MAGIGDRRQYSNDAAGVAALFHKTLEIGDVDAPLVGFDHIGGLEPVYRDQKHRFGLASGWNERCQRGDQAGHRAHQKPTFAVTKNCCGAPASRVWLSPLLPKPFEPIVET